MRSRMSPTLTQEDQVRDLMAFAVKECGGLDVLVNNAGLLGQEHQIQLADLETALWDRTTDVNLRSVFLASKSAIRTSDRTRRRLDHQYFIGGLDGGLSRMSNAYAASKGGVDVLTKYIATQ